MQLWVCRLLISLSLISSYSSAFPASETPVQPPSSVSPSVADERQRNLLLIADQPAPWERTAKPAVISIVAPASGETLLTIEGAYPSWTPDGRIIFISGRNGIPQVWIVNADGGNPQLVAPGPAIMPQMARNGIVTYMVPSPNGDQIWVKDSAGARSLTRGSAPSIALSGKWVVYTLAVSGHNEIWRINTDGTGKQQLTFVGDPDYPDANAAAISPDETQIAIFSGKESTGPTQDPSTWGYRNVAVIPASGGARKTLTPCKPVQQQPTTCVAADNPAWTPDGKWLVFDTEKPGVWMVDPNGQGFQQFYAKSRGPSRVPLKQQ